VKREEHPMADETMPALPVLRKQLVEQPDLLRVLISETVQALLGAEADAICGAQYGERSPERSNQRNGYRERRWDTRAGTIDLRIPSCVRAATSPTGCWSGAAAARRR
jgi:putative transposase